MSALIFASLLLGQCPGGVCQVPSTSAPVVSYSYSYQSPTVSYQSSYSGGVYKSVYESSAPVAPKKPGLLKRLFRKR